MLSVFLKTLCLIEIDPWISHQHAWRICPPTPALSIPKQTWALKYSLFLIPNSVSYLCIQHEKSKKWCDDKREVIRCVSYKPKSDPKGNLFERQPTTVSHEYGNNNPWRGISNLRARRSGDGTMPLLGYHSLLPLYEKSMAFGFYWLNVSTNWKVFCANLFILFYFIYKLFA